MLSKKYADALGIVNWQRRGVEYVEAPQVATADPVHVIQAAAAAQLSTHAASPDAQVLTHAAAAHVSVVASIDQIATPVPIAQLSVPEVDHAAVALSTNTAKAHKDLLVVSQDGVFAGEGDALLTAMLSAIKFSRDNIIVVSANLLTQVLMDVKPRMILVFGEDAARSVLNARSPLTGLRNHIYYYGGDNIPTVATYHPSHLLTHAADKRPAWEDLCLLKKHFDVLTNQH